MLAVVAVVLLVVGFIWVANLVTAPETTSDDTSTAAPSDPGDPTSSATTSQTPAPTPSVLAGCSEIPASDGAARSVSGDPDADAVRGKTLVATITTNCGPITLELFGDKAPAAVASFVLLAQEKYWDATVCHRLTGDEQGLWVLQCGDPTGTGSGPGPGYHFGVENAPTDGRYPTGTVAMARRSGDPNSNGDQFFIVYQDTTLPPSDGAGYTVFGTVTSGMELVDRIAAAGINPADGSSPLAPLSILGVSVQAKA